VGGRHSPIPEWMDAWEGWTADACMRSFDGCTGEREPSMHTIPPMNSSVPSAHSFILPLWILIHNGGVKECADEKRNARMGKGMHG
jgi:hypothetical protein